MFVYFHETDSFPYQPIHPLWAFMISMVAFLIFLMIDRTIKKSRKQSFQHDQGNIWLQHNTLLSFIHSFISSIFIIVAVLRAPEMFHDPMSHTNFFNYALIAFSLGYFIWDFFDCTLNSSSSMLAILFHHIIVISFLLLILIRSRNVGYALQALSLEINSVFLHGRRLLRWYNPISSSVDVQQLLKNIMDIGNYVTFIIFRFVVVIHGLYMSYIERHRLDRLSHVVVVLSVSGIGVLNVVLFYRLVKNQLKRKIKSVNKARRSHSIIADN
jgi:hypothetical protein